MRSEPLSQGAACVRVANPASSVITRLSLQHVLGFDGCDFRHCGEHVRTVHGSPLHAVAVINLPLSRLFVYVELLKTNTRSLHNPLHKPRFSSELIEVVKTPPKWILSHLLEYKVGIFKSTVHFMSYKRLFHHV